MKTEVLFLSGVAVIIVAIILVFFFLRFHHVFLARGKDKIAKVTVVYDREDSLYPYPNIEWDSDSVSQLDMISIALLYISKVRYLFERGSPDQEEWMTDTLNMFLDVLVGYRSHSFGSDQEDEATPYPTGECFRDAANQYLDATIMEISSNYPFTYMDSHGAHRREGYSIQLVRGRSSNYILNSCPVQTSQLGLSFSAQSLYMNVAEMLDPEHLKLLHRATSYYHALENNSDEFRDLIGFSTSRLVDVGPYIVMYAIEQAIDRE